MQTLVKSSIDENKEFWSIGNSLGSHYFKLLKKYNQTVITWKSNSGIRNIAETCHNNLFSLILSWIYPLLKTDTFFKLNQCTSITLKELQYCYFTNYSYVVITLFNTGSYKSGFSTFSCRKIIFVLLHFSYFLSVLR